MATLRFEALKKAFQKKPLQIDFPMKKSKRFGENVFGIETMRQYLTNDALNSVKSAIDNY